jgi:hypothetical protein
MSGPIVRKYGFPNFEKIFGERELQHGLEQGETEEGAASDASPASKPAKAAKAPAKPRSRKKKSDE